MVKLISVHIENYKSIDKAFINLTSGLWHVKGVNNDSKFKSNGAGKSSVLEAICQGLFNYNPSVINIEDTYNRITGKPYKIIVQFSKNNTTYVVNNDRVNGTITVTKDNVIVNTRSIKATLQYIKDVIGMDYRTFVATSFISNKTMLSMLDALTSSSLMKVLLDFDEISELKSSITKQVSTLKSAIELLNVEKSSINNSLHITKDFVEVDVSKYYKALHKLELKLKTEKESLPNLEEIHSDITKISLDIDKTNLLINNPDSVCDTCGSALDTSHKDKLLERLSELLRQEAVIGGVYDSAVDQHIQLELSYKTKIENLKSTVQLVEYKNSQSRQYSKDISDLNSRLSEIEGKLMVMYKELDMCTTILSVINSGKLHNNLIKELVKVFLQGVNNYKSLLSLDYINIGVVPTKDSIDLVIQDNRTNSVIDINTLSGGELTRVRLSVLFSMLDTITKITGNKTNLLIFDESLDTLDDTAASDLSRLFDSFIRNNDMFIAMVSHGAQLNEIDFTGEIVVSKTNNITKVEQNATYQ